MSLLFTLLVWMTQILLLDDKILGTLERLERLTYAQQRAFKMKFVTKVAKN